jgi:hypothetical protein
MSKCSFCKTGKMEEIEQIKKRNGDMWIYTRCDNCGSDETTVVYAPTSIASGDKNIN